MNKYLKAILIIVGLYFILLFVSGLLADRSFYSQSYSAKFCYKHPMNCLNSLLSFSPKVKNYVESFQNGIVIPCIESEEVYCPE